MTLDKCRKALDDIDRQLVGLLEQRMAVSRQVAVVKKMTGLPVFDAPREAVVLESRRAMAKDAGNEAAIVAVYEAILAQSRDVQACLMNNDNSTE